MLAGRVKLKNFLLVAGALGAAGIVGLYVAFSGGSDSPTQTASAMPAIRPDTEPAAPAMQAVAAPSAQPAQPAQPAAGAGASAMRPADEMMFSYRGKALGDGKRKDASPGKPFKINLYQDAGHSQINRAKLDLDRDEKWDEKWTFDGDRVSRKVAPNDDENYTESYVWDGTASWVKE